MARIGFLGDGQLARMSAMAAINCRHQVYFFGKDPHGPCASLGQIIPGDHTDFSHLESFLQQVELVTLENEFYPAHILQHIGDKLPLFPSAESFLLVENKWDQRQKCQALGVKIAPSVRITHQTFAQLQQQFGPVFMVKANKGGYDGYGNMLVRTAEEWQRAQELFGADNLLAEQLIDLEREYAVTIARNHRGEVVSYPVVETVQVNHKCAEVLFSSDLSAVISQEITSSALQLMHQLNLVGVCSFEFFYTQKGEIIFNELAPRPHNSGHFTMDACENSQFINHILAITGATLASPRPLYPAAVMFNLLGTQQGAAEFQLPSRFLAMPEVHVHLYQKKISRVGRKMGHINLVGASLPALRALAQEINQEVRI